VGLHYRMESHRNYAVFVLTGGPCGGKTTLLTRLTEKLMARGIHVSYECAEFMKLIVGMILQVYTVPEIPTIMISNGAPYPGINAEKEILLQYEQTMLDLQLQVENAFVGIAKTNAKPAIIVCDRGAIDIAAYLTPGFWIETMEKSGQTTESLRERYDSVIHLVTAADGAESFYTRSNNAARTETAEEARQLDLKTQNAWAGHASLHIIRNEPAGFDAKIDQSITIIESRISEILGE
jgi:predicted ATPase